jgi:hypothetical protein
MLEDAFIETAACRGCSQQVKQEDSQRDVEAERSK